MSTYAGTDNIFPPTRAIRAFVVDVKCTEDALHVRLEDGREISAPLEWYPRLRDATPEQRKNWRLIGRGVGIHWEDVDEDISVVGLLQS
jgi:hypothetical protein